jgi:Kef-type K+ transport system membrane component KefB
MDVLVSILLLLLGAKVGGELVEHLGYPSIIGELAGGIVLGPSVLSLVEPGVVLERFAYMGILLLMFLAGAETNVRDLAKEGKISALVAISGVSLPLILGFGLSMAYGYGTLESLFIGAALTATSVGITVRVLLDSGHLNSPVGLTILGAAVIDDIIAVLILTLLAGVATAEGFSLLGVGKVLAVMGAFFVIAIVVGYALVKRIIPLTHMLRTEAAVESVALIFILVLSLLAEEMYVAGISGSFIAGVLIAQTPEKGHVVNNTKVVGYAFFIPMFFATVGALVDVKGIGAVGTFGVLLIAVAIAGKVLASFSTCIVHCFKKRDALVVGVGMVPRMEVAIVIANTGLVAGIIDSPLYTAVILMAFATTLITPPLLRILLPVNNQQ